VKKPKIHRKHTENGKSAYVGGMEILHTILVFLHIVGAAALLGGWLATFKTPTVGLFQFIGAWVQLVTGILLVGLNEMGDGSVNHVKIAVKLVILIAILVAAWIGRRKVKNNEPVSVGIAHTVGGLTLVNIALAVFW
jgi:hypothetical protein